ncbi:hypothetical protein [Mammaliicoccus sciuri]|uniref:hypothetical protein n=1 Tax=Mammaliicoccus sciuri TaxID=1296 RepID=UPI001304DDEE|nr:hypothetical protein [Mammaliicoccus sciuri]
MTINKMPLEERIKLVEDIIGGHLTIYSAAKTQGVSSALTPGCGSKIKTLSLNSY